MALTVAAYLEQEKSLPAPRSVLLYVKCISPNRVKVLNYLQAPVGLVLI